MSVFPASHSLAEDSEKQEKFKIQRCKPATASWQDVSPAAAGKTTVRDLLDPTQWHYRIVSTEPEG